LGFILFNFWVIVLLYIKIAESIDGNFQGACVDAIIIGFTGKWPELAHPLIYIQDILNDPAFFNQVIARNNLFIVKIFAWINLILGYFYAASVYLGIVCYEILQFSCGWLAEHPIHPITHNIHPYMLTIILSIYLLFILFFLNFTQNINIKTSLKTLFICIYIYMVFYIYKNFIMYATIFKLYPMFGILFGLVYFSILIIFLYLEFKKDAQKLRE
jgi:hypothetical protein